MKGTEMQEEIKIFYSSILVISHQIINHMHDHPTAHPFVIPGCAAPDPFAGIFTSPPETKTS